MLMEAIKGRQTSINFYCLWSPYSITRSYEHYIISPILSRNGVLAVGDSTFEHFGTLQWKLVGCLFLGWLMAGAGLINGVKSTGKAIYFTALFPYVVLTILLGVGQSQSITIKKNYRFQTLISYANYTHGRGNFLIYERLYSLFLIMRNWGL